ncbi:MAG: mechanosensitive ion channel [Bdellovibrionota bacterium]
MNVDIQKWTEMIFINYSPKIIGAIVTLVVGWILIGWFLKVIFRLMERRKLEQSLQTFLHSLLGIVLKTLLLLSVAGMLGLKTTSFLAALGAIGLAVGLALQGSLSNFAGGVLILMFRPFRVGDTVEAQGYIGTVRAITIFNTVVITADNKTVFIPNGSLVNGAITNYTETDTRRIDLLFGVGYQDDINKVREVIKTILAEKKEILDQPEPLIAVHSLGDNSVNFAVRPWVKNDDYWKVYFALQEDIKKAFDKANISIPFPQRDVHLYQVSANNKIE